MARQSPKIGGNSKKGRQHFHNIKTGKYARQFERTARNKERKAAKRLRNLAQAKASQGSTRLVRWPHKPEDAGASPVPATGSSGTRDSGKQEGRAMTNSRPSIIYRGLRQAKRNRRFSEQRSSGR